MKQIAVATRSKVWVCSFSLRVRISWGVWNFLSWAGAN